MANQIRNKDSASQKGQVHMASKEKVSPVSSTDKTCKDKTDDYPGMVSQRVPEHMDLKRAKAWHEDVYRLRLEGTCIPCTALATAKSNTGRKQWVRDILIPGSLPLYALHYTIQEQFAVMADNSHYFSLPQDIWQKLTQKDTEKWLSLVGVLFQSPIQREKDTLWTVQNSKNNQDRNMLREDAGPYVATDHREGIWQCTVDMHEAMQKTVLTQMDLSALPKFFHAPIDHLLERLPVEHILAFHDRDCGDRLAEGERCFDSYASFMHEDLVEDIDDLLFFGTDEPACQPSIDSPTDTLYYTGKGEKGSLQVKITGSKDAVDLINEGLVTRETLDEALRTVFTEYRPVGIAAQEKNA